MKTKAQRRNIISSWLSILILLFAGLDVAIGLWAFIQGKNQLNKISAFSPTPDAAIPSLIDDESLKITMQSRITDSTSRPLWISSRRPYTAPPPPKKVEVVEEKPEKIIPPLDAQLNSVILASNAQMIFLTTSEGIVRLEPGMSYNGWMLKNINEDSAEFHFDEEKKVLQLRSFAVVESQKTRSLGQEIKKPTKK